MFDGDDQTFIHTDQNPYTYVDQDNVLLHNYAYRKFDWDEEGGDGDGKLSESSCTQEALTIIDGTSGVTLKLHDFVIASHEHINRVNRKIINYCYYSNSNIFQLILGREIFSLFPSILEILFVRKSFPFPSFKIDGNVISNS